MNTTTNKRMNLHMHKGGRMASFQIPKEMDDLIEQVATRNNMSFSAYVKYAINNQLEHDLSEPV